MSQYTYVDLFSGAGGLTLGFNKAEFKNIFSVEFNPEFAETYKKNFKSHNLIIADIAKIDNEQIKKYIKNEEVDVVVGGPPCQGFSLAGNVGRRFLDDERNQLFKEYLRFVNEIKPKIFIMENVAALLTHNKGKTIKEIENGFNEIGYDIKYEVLNASKYGVPQERRRIVVVGTKGENTFEYPEKSKKTRTIKDAIDDLPTLESGQRSEIANHIAMKHSEQMLKKMSYIFDGGNRNDIPEEIRPKTGDARKYIRYDSTKPSYCVTGDMRKIFHYNQNRALTIRELARIQTFPDDFKFSGNSCSIQQQIGNAVPPILAEKLAVKVKEFLKNNE